MKTFEMNVYYRNEELQSNLPDANGAMLGEITNTSLHHASYGEKSGKILFQSFHSLLVKKNTVSSTSILTSRISTVKVSVVEAF